MPKMDFLGTEAKPAFKKRVHRPWNSKLLDETLYVDGSIQDASQLTSQLQSAAHSHMTQLYSSNISIGGFLRLPARDKDTSSFNPFKPQPELPAILPNEIQQWQSDLAAEKLKNEVLLADKQQLEQQINDLASEFTVKQNDLTLEISELHTQLKSAISEKDALDADYQNALQYLQEERIEREELQNQILQQTEVLQAETARRMQAERNESLISESIANFEAESVLLEKNKKALEADTEAFIEKRSKMEAINENEQKLRKLYEEKMKGLHENVFQLERQLKVEVEQKYHLEQKVAQFFENMKIVETEKKEIEQENFILDQEIKLQQNHILALESKLKDEVKVRRAFESTFSDALSKN